MQVGAVSTGPAQVTVVPARPGQLDSPLERAVNGYLEHLTVERHRDLARVALGQAEVHEARGQSSGFRVQGRRRPDP